MYRIAPDGLVIDPADGRRVGRNVDSFATALGAETERGLVIFRLWRKATQPPGAVLPGDLVHQFALPAPRAAELARQLLELAAMTEREQLPPRSAPTSGQT